MKFDNLQIEATSENINFNEYYTNVDSVVWYDKSYIIKNKFLINIIFFIFLLNFSLMKNWIWGI